MIELRVERFERGLQICEVKKPAALRIDASLANEFDLEAVAVQAGAFVAWRDIRKAVRRFKGELARKAHRRDITVWV